MQAELETWSLKVDREGISNESFDKHTHIRSGHGRIETRNYQQTLIDCSWLAKNYRWTGLKNVVKISSETVEKTKRKITK